VKKQDERKPEEIAKDLETVDFPEIAEGDLRDIFGGESEIYIRDVNCNCCC
jgi:hypothetical protein